MSGWIKLHREIKNNWIWQDKPFDRRSAWIDILLSANHKDNKFLLGTELVEVERGSFITSEVKLMERWGWSNTKVRNFLTLLENDKMIVKISDRKKSTLTVLNYNDYQDTESTEKVLEKYEKSTKEVIKNTNKNDKKEKNEKNVKEVKNIYAEFVTMTETEYNKLITDYGETFTKKMIDKLDNYKGSKGKKYASDYRTILNWIAKDKEKGEINGKPKGNNGTSIDGRRASEESLRLERIAIETGLLDKNGRCKPIGEIDF